MTSSGRPGVRLPDRLLGVPLFPLVATVLSFACVGASLWYQGGGFLEYEALSLIQYYLVDRPFLQKIFDINRTDFGLYYARELAYAVSYLDARFILASIRAGVPHFYPVSHYAAILTVVFLHLRWGRRYFTAIPASVLLLLALLYLTTPNSFFAVFFTASKATAGVGLFATIWYAFVVSDPIRAPVRGSEHETSTDMLGRVDWRQVLAIFVLGLVTSLFDRQGFSAMLLLLAVSGLLMFLERSGRYVVLTLTFLGVVLVNSFYNLVLGPRLIQLTNGYAPSMDHQDLLGALLERPQAFDPGNVLAALAVVPDVVSAFFGNLGTLFGVLILAAGLYVATTCAATTADAGHGLLGRLVRARYGLVFAGSVFTVCAMSWVFTFVKGYMLAPESRLVYYWVPFNAAILFGATATIQLLLTRWPQARVVLLGALSVLLALNVYAIPDHYRSYLYPGSSWKWFERAPAMLECVSDPLVDAPIRGLRPLEASACLFIRRRIDPAATGPSQDPETDRQWAVRYWTGRGAPQERDESVFWLRRSAAAGHAQSNEDLGLLLLARAERADAGEGPALFDEAEQQLLRAAELGSVRSQRALGRVLEEGIGDRPPDRVEALMWHYLASEAGDEEAAERVAELESALKEGERARARDRAAAWRRLHPLERSFLPDRDFSESR